jgi:hypothetical protein
MLEGHYWQAENGLSPYMRCDKDENLLSPTDALKYFSNAIKQVQKYVRNTTQHYTTQHNFPRFNTNHSICNMASDRVTKLTVRPTFVTIGRRTNLE